MSVVVQNSKILNLTANTEAQTAQLNVGTFDSVCYQLHYTDATPGAQNFTHSDVTPASDEITITAHGFFTGLKTALTGTNLPGGLSATNYWIIVVDANTIKLATSLANAEAGTVVDITSAGTTTDAALTPASLSQVVKLQQSNDGTTYFDVSGDSVTITGAGDTLWLVTAPPALWHQVVVTPTSGALTIWVLPCGRNNSIVQS